MAYEGTPEEIRRENVRRRVREIKTLLRALSTDCVTSSVNIIQALHRLLDAVVSDETGGY